MNDDFYTQCTFQRGTAETRGWIPSWAARKGNLVQLLSLDGEFWCVTSAGQKVTKDYLKDNERNYKEFQHSIK